jgi:hypothetical protein
MPQQPAVDTPATARAPAKEMTPPSRADAAQPGRFWPDDIRLVVSISMQVEAGSQPREGIPRMLDLWDRRGVKVTSHMIGEAAQRHPELAKEIAIFRTAGRGRVREARRGRLNADAPSPSAVDAPSTGRVQATVVCLQREVRTAPLPTPVRSI